MAARKRPGDQCQMAAEANPKRRRQYSELAPEENTELMCDTAATAQADLISTSQTSILDLPAELILQIFESAREPCMIHTCKKFYDALPGYVYSTRNMLGLTYGTRGVDGDMRQHLADCWPLSGGDAEHRWEFDELNDLQRQVSTSAWLTVRHLEQIYIILFRVALAVDVTSSWRVKACDSVRAALEAITPKAYVPLKPETRIRLPVTVLDWCDNGWDDDSNCDEDPGTVTIRDLFARLEKNGDAIFMEFDYLYVKYIPDCLITHEPSEDTDYIRDIFLRTAAKGRHNALPGDNFEDENIEDEEELYCTYPVEVNERNTPGNLKCNADLLQSRIWRTLDEGSGNPTELYKWLLLNQACGCPVSVTSDMLKICIRRNLPGFLRLLIGSHLRVSHHPNEPDGAPQQSRMERRTEVRYQDLLDTRAEAASFIPQRWECIYEIDMELNGFAQLMDDANALGFSTVKAMANAKDRNFDIAEEEEAWLDGWRPWECPLEQYLREIEWLKPEDSRLEVPDMDVAYDAVFVDRNVFDDDYESCYRSVLNSDSEF